jgi:hypothetical protein
VTAYPGIRTGLLVTLAARHNNDHRFITSLNLINLGGFMGKYFIGWLLGVPVFVLVLIYLFFH